MVRHHPQWSRVLDLISSGAIGTVTSFHGHFSYMNTDESDIRNSTDTGGCLRGYEFRYQLRDRPSYERAALVSGGTRDADLRHTTGTVSERAGTRYCRANMAVIDAVAESARSGTRVTPKR
jgi:predicted dehydrogenase